MTFKQMELMDFECFECSDTLSESMEEEFIINMLNRFMQTKVLEKMRVCNITRLEYTFKPSVSEKTWFCCMFRKDGVALLDIFLSPVMISYQHNTIGTRDLPVLREMVADYFHKMNETFEECKT